MKTILGYLGPKGTFSEEAANEYKNKINQYMFLKPCQSIEQVIHEVDNGTLEEGIVPVENTIEGSLNIVLDSLAWVANLYIKKEIIIPISHHLLAKKGISLLDIELIISHPQAIAQCRNFIRSYLPDVEVLYTTSTAEAALIAAESTKRYGVIGNRYAGEIYGLEAIASDIQDVLENTTRFIVLTRKNNKMRNIKEGNKVSIVFGLMDYPGSLVKVLQEFSKREINLTRIESRPAKRKLGEYIFYVDFIWNHSDKKVEEFFTLIQSQVTFFKQLGFYEQI